MSERTAEERARARQEREQRRAARAGQVSPEPPPQSPTESSLLPSSVESSPPSPQEVRPPVDPGPAVTESPADPEHVAAVASPPPPEPTRRPIRSPADSLRARSRTRSGGTRIAALVALGAVIVAVVVVLATRSSSHTTTSPPAPQVVKVLIPEGESRLQIVQIAARSGLTGDYRAASRRSPQLNPSSYGAPAHTPDLEGFLFPATYDMYPHASVGRLVEEQLAAFKENFGLSEISRAHALHVTPYQLLIVASMVEREAQVPGDRAKIAAVIYNRLHRGMPLGIDATLYYAIEQRDGIPTYTHELTEAQLHMESAYNTRTHVGLPPTPIANPGLASITAAAEPAHVSYLYYVLAADGCGEHVFSNTAAEFESNAAAYQAALSKNGGKPLRCKKK